MWHLPIPHKYSTWLLSSIFGRQELQCQDICRILRKMELEARNHWRIRDGREIYLLELSPPASNPSTISRLRTISDMWYRWSNYICEMWCRMMCEVAKSDLGVRIFGVKNFSTTVKSMYIRLKSWLKNMYILFLKWNKKFHSRVKMEE